MKRWTVIKIVDDIADITNYLLRISTDFLAYRDRYIEIMNGDKPWSLSKESKEFYINNALKKRLELLERENDD